MKKYYVFFLPILILALFTSCVNNQPNNNIIFQQNYESSQTEEQDTIPFYSAPRMTEVQRQEIIDIIEKSSLRYDGSKLEGNLEVEYFYQGAGLGRQDEYHTSFMNYGYGSIEYSPYDFEVFDETFFFPEASGEYIYLIFIFMNGGGNSYIDECVSANIENGVLTLVIKRTPENFEPIEAYDEPVAIFKIKKSSLGCDIKQVNYEIDYSALK